MRNGTTIFNFNNNQIRTLEIKGQPWFVASDICNILYGKSAGNGHVYDVVDTNEKSKVKRIHLGLNAGRDMIIISESGLYKLIMRSDKKEAKAFQNWVTQVVLPAIRKDGAYVQGEEKVATGELTENEFILKAMTILQSKTERLTSERNQARSVIEEHLLKLTVDEWRALNHSYLSHSQKTRLGQIASTLSMAIGLTKETQKRVLFYGNAEREVVVNVYPKQILDQAALVLGIKGGALGHLKVA